MLPRFWSALDPFVVQALLTDFLALAQTQTLPKHQLLHKEGQVCQTLYFVEQGVLHSYYHKDGKAITAHFATEGQLVSAIDSYIQQKPSRYNIEVLEEATVHSIRRQELEQLLVQRPAYERCIRLACEQLYIDLAERVEALLFHSAKERYHNLLKSHPNLPQRVNLGYIASYLGITPETLSRIRAQASTF